MKSKGAVAGVGTTLRDSRFLAQAAMIAAIYVVLTYLVNALGLASGAIQVRLSEMLCLLPIFSWAAVPGVTVGCFLANLLTGCCPLDIVMGSIATLIGALGARLLRRQRLLTPLPTIVANTIIVPCVLASPYGYGLEGSIPFMAVTVAAGEIISCGILGLMLVKVIYRWGPERFFGSEIKA